VARFEQIGLGEPADGVHSRRALVRGALFVAAVAVIAGAVVGHFIWSSTPTVSTAPVAPAGSKSTTPSQHLDQHY